MRGRAATVLGMAVAFVLAVAGRTAAQSAYVFVSPDRPYDVRVTKREHDMKKLLAAPHLPETELKGQKLWAQRCALCHESRLGPWIDTRSVTALGDVRVREVINAGSGRMPGFQYALRPAQVDQVVAFLKTVTPDQRPVRLGAPTVETGGR